MSEAVRLQRYLAAGGVAARRKAEDLITAGRVKVNGKVVSELGSKIIPDKDRVEVDGEAVVALDKFYVLLNKPKACITSVTDDRGRPTVMDYLPNLPIPVKPVGRLDFYTEGVLLLTNDGELAARLLAPGNHVPKTYHVKVHGDLHKDELVRLREGVRLDDGTLTMPAEVTALPSESKHSWVAITIHEGKHRQIHRMIEALGHTVDKLQRVAFANLSFHNLRIGDARELDQMELNELRDLVGLDHSTSARGRWRSDREATDIPRRARAKARAEAEAEVEAGATPPGIPPRHAVATTPHESADRRPARDTDRRPPRDEDRRPRGPARESRGARDSRGPARDSRGPARDSRGPARDSRGPARDSRGPARDSRGPARASRGAGAPPARASRDYRDRDARPPARDTRSAAPARDSRGPAPTRDRRGVAPEPRGGQGRSFGKRDQRERPASGDRVPSARPSARPAAPRPSSARPSSARPARGGRPPARSGPPSRGNRAPQRGSRR